MIRVASQLTFCSPNEILRRAVVEQDEQGIISRRFSLDENSVESANTLFYDGIISAGIISVKENAGNFSELVSDYNYIDLSGGGISVIPKNLKPLLIDFGTNSVEKANLQLSDFAPALSGFTVFEIIAACCYFPALALGKTTSLSIGTKTELLLWEKADLIEKKMTEHTHIRKIC